MAFTRASSTAWFHYNWKLAPGVPAMALPSPPVRLALLQVVNGTTVVAESATATVSVAATAPGVSTFRPLFLSSNRTTITVTLTDGLAGAARSTIASIWLVPEVAAPTNGTLIAAAMSARFPCDNISPSASARELTCTSPALRSGRYQLMVEVADGPALLSSDVASSTMAISGISASSGSIGGGLMLLISGTGFPEVTAEAVVFMTVPASTTFLNGLIPCDVNSASFDLITCITRPHVAANADANDPMAKLLQPMASTPAPVQVLACSADMNSTVLREYCWSLPTAVKAACNDPSGCKFG